MTKKKIFFIKSRLSPSLCFPSRAVFPAGWRKDMRVPGVLHRALHNEASVENKMPQTRIILIKSWNQPCVKIQGKVSGEHWRNGEWAWELQGRTWGDVSKAVWGETWIFQWLAWSFSAPKNVCSPILWWYFGKALQWHGKISPLWWGNIRFTHVEQIWQTPRLCPWDMTDKYLSCFNSKLNPKAGKTLAFKTNLL